MVLSEWWTCSTPKTIVANNWRSFQQPCVVRTMLASIFAGVIGHVYFPAVQERKQLVAGGYRDRHFNAGSWLLGAGVVIAIEGCLNTYTRTG